MTEEYVNYRRALEAVQARVALSRSSFLAGMSVLAKERREAMYGLYAFCREVDDIADDSPTPKQSAEGLALWRARISALFQGRFSDSITEILQPAIARFHLIEKDFQDIIDGMRMDASIIRAPDMDTLDRYCDRVASAVGRVSVRIFGDDSIQAMDVAYHLGRALQLTNILRDLEEDAQRGRIYLPLELLVKHGIETREPSEILHNVKLSDVCRDLALITEEHFKKADLSMAQCQPSAMKPARIMRAYYGAIFDKLRREDWRDPKQRVSLSKIHKFWLALRFWVG